MPSILDRIIDPESAGTVAQRGYTERQMEQAVRRDLEELLNTRQPYSDLPPEYVQCRSSILNYGLPDLNSLQAYTPTQREEIGKILEAVIGVHEPRLRDIHVSLRGGGEPTDRAIRFRVDAKLRLDPAPEIAFDTILELMTGHYTVQSAAAS